MNLIVVNANVARRNKDNAFIGINSFGDSSNYTQLSATGDVLFTGSSGLAFAEIHSHDNSTVDTVAAGTTYTKLTTFIDNGFSNNCTPDYANNKITITKPGIYLVNCSINGSSATPNITFRFSPFLNGVEQSNIHCHRKYTTAGDDGSAAMSGLIDVSTSNLDLDVRARHDGVGDVNLTVNYMNLSVVQVGGT